MDQIKDIFKIVDSLPFCTSKEEVESLFSEYSVLGPVDKRHLLMKAMKVSETYNADSGETISPEDEYQYELEIFIEGSWRLLAI